METRIYVIEQKGTSPNVFRLVEATSAAQAIRHCVKSVYAAKAATPKDIATFMSIGTTVEKATEQTNEQTTKQ